MYMYDVCKSLEEGPTSHLLIQCQECNVVVERFGWLFTLSVFAPVVVGILGAPPGVDLDVDHGVVGGLSFVVTA